MNPTNSDNWHEIADVCSSVSVVNGVTVQSYWSQRDKACVIPMDIPVTKQITCIRKHWGHYDPIHPIEYVGGVTIENGKRFFLTLRECIQDIDRGNKYFVMGADGSRADVAVYTHFCPWSPFGFRYIATVADASKEDNLLSLPDC